MSSPSDTVFQDMLKTPPMSRQFSGPGYRSDQPFKGFDGVTLTHKEFIKKLEERLGLLRRDNTKLKRDNTKLRNMLIEINNRLRATTTQPLNGGRKSRRKRHRRNTKKRKRKTNRKTKAVK